MLSIHGRTRADKYLGEAEYDTIAAIKRAVSIPVLANGDIVQPNAFAIYRYRQVESGDRGPHIESVGQVMEIVVLVRSDQNRLLGVLFKRYNTSSEPTPPYQMPRCTPAVAEHHSQSVYDFVPYEVSHARRTLPWLARDSS